MYANRNNRADEVESKRRSLHELRQWVGYGGAMFKLVLWELYQMTQMAKAARS